MGTHAIVARIESTAHARAIYCHYDGYPEFSYFEQGEYKTEPGLGARLYDHYWLGSQVKSLLDMGNASSIGDTIPECEFHKRDMGRKWDEAATQVVILPDEPEQDKRFSASDLNRRFEPLVAMAASYGAEWIYVMVHNKGDNGLDGKDEWLVTKVNHTAWQPLSGVLKREPISHQ